MMEFITQNKLLTAGVAIAIAALLYWAFFMQNGSTPALTTTDVGVTAPAQELLATLAALNTIQLDAHSTLFQDPAFVSLTDFGVVIPLQPVGRRNPFAPLSGTPTQSPTILKLPSLGH